MAKRFGSLDFGVERWVQDNRAALEHATNPRLIWIKYEDIVGDFERSITRILEALGESFDPALKESNRAMSGLRPTGEKPRDVSGKNHNLHRQWQLNQPLFDGRGRYRELSPEDLARVESTAGGLLRHFGYPVPALPSADPTSVA